MRFVSKQALIDQILEERKKLETALASLDPRELTEPGVWGDGWSIKDLMAHLVEWEQMLLRWYRESAAGGVPEVPAPGYTWRETPALNQAIWKKHAERSLAAVRRDFASSYRETLETVREIPEEVLLNPGAMPWSNTPLASYVAANTCSHYRTANKILRRWLRSTDRSRAAGGTS